MAAKELLVIVMVLLIPSCFTEFGLKVYIDSFYFDKVLLKDTPYREEKFTLSSLILCSAACWEHSDWCVVYCFDKSTKLCLLTNLMVSPFHKDSEERSVKCHTYLKRDLAFGSGVSSSAIKSDFLPNGTAEALTRGIYNYALTQTCTGLDTSLNSYVLFDLKKLYNISEIRVTTQPDTNEQNLPKGTEIKIGERAPDSEGDFSSYTLFTTIPEDVQEKKTYSFTKDSPVHGQYVSFQTTTTGRLNFVLCYVQIFE